MVRINLSLATILTAALIAAGAYSSSLSAATKATVAVEYGKLPLVFEANQGQTDERVKFLSRGRGYSLFLTESEVVLSLRAAGNKGHALRVKLLGAKADPKMTGLDRLPGISNYFIGRDRSKWRTGVPHYAKVGYEGVYPGIDLVFYGTKQRQLEYDFVIAPGADPDAIGLSFEGAEKLEINETGDLIAHLPGGQVRFLKPAIYQEADGAKQPVAGGYALKDGRVTFDLAAYDPAKPLVIDPVLAYSTYLGGTDTEDSVRSIAVDGAGNAYIAGQTRSADFPIVGGFQDTCVETAGSVGCHIAFVAKLDATGSNLLYSTYLGGASIETAWGIALDVNGNAYVAGSIGHGSIITDDFPTTLGAFQESAISRSDAFFAKLDTAGGLAYSTYLGGSRSDNAWDIAVDSAGRAVIGGETGSDDFPTTTGALDTICGDDIDDTDCSFSTNDGFLAVIDPAGNGTADLVYSTFVGGDNDDPIFGVAVDGADLVYLTGYTASSDFPTTAGALQNTSSSSGISAMLTVINPAEGGSNGLIYSTYLRGDNGGTIGRDVDIEPGCVSPCRAYLTGTVGDDTFPTTPNAVVPFPVVGFGTFVTIIDPVNGTLDYSTFFGGYGGWGIAAGPDGRVYVAGHVGGGGSIPVRDAIQDENLQYGDAFIAVIDPFAEIDLFGNNLNTGLLFATYLGGTSGESALAIAVDGAGTEGDPFAAYVAGATGSQDFPTTPDAFQPELSIGEATKKRGRPRQPEVHSDAFIAKIDGPFEGMELVEPLNFKPMAVDDAYATEEDVVLSISAEAEKGLLANDSDPNVDPLTVSSNGSPENGTVIVNSDGSFIYTPNANFFGTDSFTYTASDGSSEDSATVTISVTPVNDPPVAADDGYANIEGVPLDVNAASGVLANDSDIDGDNLTASLLSGPALGGTVVMNLDGRFTYIPPGSFSGIDTFTYTVADGNGGSDTATVTVTVNPVVVGHEPVANDDAYLMFQNATLTVPVPGVLANDTDSENHPLTAVLVDPPSNGTVTLNSDGSFTYTPPDSFSGTGAFTYKASDGVADSVAPVTIEVGDRTMHVGDLVPLTDIGGKFWTAIAYVSIHDALDRGIFGAIVSGRWDGASGSAQEAECTTSSQSVNFGHLNEIREGGWCSVWIEGIPKKISSVTFTVQNVSHSDLLYVQGDNHDPDGDSIIASDGTSITVTR